MRKSLYKKLPIFIGLLLCLCFSKGEGVHLLPFSDLSENYSLSNSELETASTKYHLSTHSQNGFDGKFQPRNLKNTLKDFPAPHGLIFYQNSSERNDKLNKNHTSKPKIAVSKILLFALADRAPPCLI